MKHLLPLGNSKYRYKRIIGTGGIGSGMFFSLEGTHTLGRNESRLGRMLPFKDYCKLHIIIHYIAVMLGSGSNTDFTAYPIGRVGNDSTGKELLAEIQSAGMDTRYITVDAACSTLFSVCFQYPDNTGGNITTSESASSKVSPQDIADFFQSFPNDGIPELILAAPEVPLDARIALLQAGRTRSSFNIACILSSETEQFTIAGGFELVDLLSINIDEARSIVQITQETVSSKVVVDACIEALSAINPDIALLITDGPFGSYCYKNGYLEYTPVPAVKVIATAGAGDTFLAGTVAGLCCHLPLTKGRSDAVFSETPVTSAVELGTLLASLAVTSPDTIHQTADAALLYTFCKDHEVRLGSDFKKLFDSGMK